MVKKELRIIWDKINWELTNTPQSILELSKKSGISWEATKNYLEIMSYLGYIDIEKKNKRFKYLKTQKYKKLVFKFKEILNTYKNTDIEEEINYLIEKFDKIFIEYK